VVASSPGLSLPFLVKWENWKESLVS